jgi:Flp pilus assembly protein TadG
MPQLRKAARGLLCRHEGTAAVEFGLILPLLMVVLLGIIDYGQVYFTRLTMSNAAREGARVGVTLDAGSAATAAASAAKIYLTNAGLSATVSSTTPSQADPRVTVTVTQDPFIPLVGFVPVPAQLTVSATMRWELATP